MDYLVKDRRTKSDALQLKEIEIGEEVFYKISQVDKMRPFFISVVSDSNHWLFLSSNGGVTAGRKNAEYALFPYYTDDKIIESAEVTGCKTILIIEVEGQKYVWEPFSVRSEAYFNYQRNIYKNKFGNKIIFEEVNHNLAITFRYEWNSSNQYGFVRNATLFNHSVNELSVKMVDGFQNVLPYGVGSDLQNETSNLVDAYKRCESLPGSGVGIFSLSAIIVDKAEPSEALKANVVWSAGLKQTMLLLSTNQLSAFRNGENVVPEVDVKGEKGAYLVQSKFILQKGQQKKWWLVANVNQSQSAVIALDNSIKHNNKLIDDVLMDVEVGTKNLVHLVAATDVLQYSGDELSNTRHFSNTLFNIMRGGIFDDGYTIGKKDFLNYYKSSNVEAFKRNENQLNALSNQFSVFQLKEIAEKSGDTDFIRLATEYLPLKFSRRHGDPSRPWNKFSINTINEIDGSKLLDYQGNWRDIFQNWEALAHAYPAFIEGMLFKFLNATTFDGYNPYRVTKNGFDWETIEPDNPWSYIGYWGDHQIIYLQKFLEFAQNYYPDLLLQLFDKPLFVYANVPYKIKRYSEIVSDPKNTILFNYEAEKEIHRRTQTMGAEGALLTDKTGKIYHVNFIEKILATILVKLSNFVADGGIWMNTQRPEWNDANNALVGNGLSMVTLFYLKRMLTFLINVLKQHNEIDIEVSVEMEEFFDKIKLIFSKTISCLEKGFSDAEIKTMLDALGIAASDYREKIYAEKFSGKKSIISTKEIITCFNHANEFLSKSIHNNKRTDNLYQTYNLISYTQDEVKVGQLTEMLEGQVAVLSASFLNAAESLQLLDALKQSSLYRQDQNSYILYPNKELPGFLQKNNIKKEWTEKSEFIRQSIAHNNFGIVEKDIQGNIHFNGNFRNVGDLVAALEKLEGQYHQLAAKEKDLLCTIYEDTFKHKEFTGRSGTFFAYEGLGSIYWHMVSKLLLAVQETCIHAIKNNADNNTINQLVKHYYDIKEGIGVHKPASLYGAFPTDAYSHTPLHKGAQQPGMTGQVKEDILCRMGELGVHVGNGKLNFNPLFLRQTEFIKEEKIIKFADGNALFKEIVLPKDSLFFTCCQVPVLYVLSETESIEITEKNGSVIAFQSTQLTASYSNLLFNRTGDITMIKVFLKAERMID